MPSPTTSTRPAAAGLSQAKRALLEKRLRGGFAGAREVIPRRGHNRPTCLSFAQRRLWFIDQLEPAQPLYNIPLAWRFEAPVRPAVLARTLGEIVRRHEILRTTYTAFLGQPRQVVGPPAPFGLPEVDLGRLDPERREAETARLAAREARRPFHLDRDRMLRGALVRLSDERLWLLLTFHHIAADGWSLDPFARELLALYESFAEGRPSPLPELPVQYADFSEWQRRWLSGENVECHLGYWRRQLEGVPRALDLPTDRPRGARQDFAGATVGFALPPTTVARLRERSRGGTLFLPLLTALVALLHRLSGQSDLTVGTPIAGRDRQEIEGLIGFFVNTMVVRSGLGGDATLDDVEEQLRRTVLDAYRHADLPFEKLVEELAGDRDLSRSPLFQVLFSFQGREPRRLRGGPLAFEPADSHPGVAKFDLSWHAVDRDETISGSVEYATRLFDPTTVRRFVEAFATVAEALAHRPGSRLAELQLLNPAQRHQLLVEWNEAGVTVGDDEGTLHGLVEAQAARTPSEAAILGGGERLSYAELDRRAETVARRLAGLGAGPERVVAVFLEREPDMVAALLGVLKTGAAYLPLDPTYPRERLTFMLRDAGAVAVISRERLLGRLDDARPPVLCLEHGAGAPVLEPPARQTVGPTNLAYLIYTSGSTGRPKGVAIEHGSARRFISWVRQSFDPADLAAVAAVTSICFDLSIFEIFGPLASGGTVLLADDALALGRIAEAPRVRLVNTVPSALAEVLRQGALPARVKTVNLAGEPISPELVARILERVERLYNLYGPSEDTTYSTWLRVRSGSAVPPIGRPIAGTRAHVLDRRSRPAPLGALGELHLGGGGLARGYFGRPARTARSFVPDPFGGPGSRLYRTGDLARHRADGILDFLGRADRQVKVRGFRVELGEIEAALTVVPGVRAAAVAARGEGSDRSLVAWVVPAGEPEPTAGELLRSLAERLPSALLPSRFVFLAELPLTANGKVDRRALPEPGAERPTPGAEPTAPRDELEHHLAEVWQGLLEVRPIGVHDNFFELGGHSMLAVRLLAEIERLTGRRLDLGSLFQAPDIARQADLLRRRIGGEARSPIVEIRPSGSQTPLVCVHPIGGNVVCYYELARLLPPDRTVLGLQAPRLDCATDPYPPIEEMAREYLAALAARSGGPPVLLGWSFGGLVAFEMALQLQAQGRPPALLVLLDSHPPEVLSRFAERADDATILAALAREHAQQLGLEVALAAEELRPLEPAARLEAVVDRLRRAGAVSSHTEAAWMARILAVYHSGLRVARAYQPACAFDGPTVLFKPADTSDEERTELSRLIELPWDDSTNGWQRRCTAAVQSVSIPGNHATLGVEPNVGALAERLTTVLGRLPSTVQDPTQPTRS